jgi:hypothetical protein
MAMASRTTVVLGFMVLVQEFRSYSIQEFRSCRSCRSGDVQELHELHESQRERIASSRGMITEMHRRLHSATPATPELLLLLYLLSAEGPDT